jgi:hypothetical protein
MPWTVFTKGVGFATNIDAAFPLEKLLVADADEEQYL